MAAEVWTNTGGRPLGIDLAPDGTLWVADAYRGLLMVSGSGEVTVRLSEVDGQAIAYADDVVVSPQGKIYFTDATMRFSAGAQGSTLQAALLDLMEHRRTGRVIEFDPETNAASVILSGLSFANGIAMDHQGKFLLINETGEYRVLKFWLQGPQKGTSEVILENLPGFPDNINRGQEGRFWVGLVASRNPMLDRWAEAPWIRKVIERLPDALGFRVKPRSHVIAISAEGEVLANFQDVAGGYPMTTGALESQSYLYVNSLVAPALGRVEKAGLF
jgi:sugar lactone lactonase YvrE